MRTVNSASQTPHVAPAAVNLAFLHTDADAVIEVCSMNL